MADDEESTSFVTQYFQERGAEMASIHSAFAVESSFNESKSQYEAIDKHEYVGFRSLARIRRQQNLHQAGNSWKRCKNTEDLKVENFNSIPWIALGRMCSKSSRRLRTQLLPVSREIGNF